MQVINYRILFISILLLLCAMVEVHAQNVYDGQVIDKTTELAIPGVTVSLLKAKEATQTSEQGYFKIIADTETESDTLIFNSVGYKTLKLGVKGGQGQIFVALEPNINQLNQVEINGHKAQDKVLHKFSWGDLKEASTHTTPFYANNSLAKLFETPQANTWLINIKIGRRSLNSSLYAPQATDSKYARFFVHICAVDSTTNAPGQILLTKELILLDNAMMITLDLSKEHLIIPGTKFFIAIEWINIPFNETVARNITSKTERTKLNGRVLDQDVSLYFVLYEPFIVGYPTSNSKMIIWSKDDDQWTIMNYPGYELALSATIRY